MTTIGNVNQVPRKADVLCNMYEIEWKIPDFFALSNEEDIFYNSPSFSFVDETWCLAMYPNGEKDNQTTGCISLYLTKESYGSPIRLDYTFGLKTFDGKKDSEHHRTHVFDDNGDYAYGTHACLAISELKQRKSVLIPDDVLTVFCNLKYPDIVEIPRKRRMLVPSTSFKKMKILEDFKQMFLQKENSDVVLTIKGQEFPAHKSILAARSPVLAAMFRNNMREKKTNNVDIGDCDPSSFPVFLCFLYCEDAESISQENVFNLYAAADKYDVPDLRSKCVDFMKENLSVDFFCETITLALKHRETELINLASKFFVKNAKKIVITAKWQTFNAENPTEGNELFIKFITSVET